MDKQNKSTADAVDDGGPAFPWGDQSAAPAGGEGMSLREEFEAFHAQNPRVYVLFRRFALEAAARRKRFGSKMIFERMRWYTQVETNDPSFKLNNNYTAYYARMFMEDYPQHEGLFETRKVGS